MIESEDLHALILSLQLATTTTILLLLVGTPLAWWLAYTPSRMKKPVAALVSLPIVLPPTVIGFYFLLLIGPHGWIGQLTQALGWGLLSFSFTGLVLASVIYSLPFVVQPIQNAFEAIGPRPLEVAATLRVTPLQAFWRVALPLARPGVITAAIMGFAHTLGEFGVVMMVGGNVANKTRVISIQIYDRVEAQQYLQAHWLAGGMVLFSFLVLLALYSLNRKPEVVV